MKKVGRNAVVLGSVEFHPSQSAREVAHPSSHLLKREKGLMGPTIELYRRTGPLGVAHQQSQPTGAGFGSWQEVRGVTHKFESSCASSELPPKLFPLEMCRVGIYSAVFVMASLLRIASGGTRNPQVSMTMVITPIRRILDLLQCDFNDSFGAETSHGLEYRLLVLKA